MHVSGMEKNALILQIILFATQIHGRCGVNFKVMKCTVYMFKEQIKFTEGKVSDVRLSLVCSLTSLLMYRQTSEVYSGSAVGDRCRRYRLLTDGIMNLLIQYSQNTPDADVIQ